MKLKNKKTGEIVKIVGLSYHHDRLFYELEDENGTFKKEINSLAELNEEWEDYEEPEELWSIDQFGEPINVTGLSSLQLEKLRRIGNLFESEEKTERAVEKLKAWEQLKDKGFKFGRWQFLDGRPGIWVRGNYAPYIVDELDILFGGKE